jgi:NAD(P)-dependent dehydrogenase (short-subunit alcohol dehydrogenase family)
VSNWFVTGISRGFGKVLTEELLARGHKVIGTTRTGESDISDEHLTVLKLDVTDAKQVAAVVEEAIATAGRLDVVVNNAGFGMVGAVEEVSPEEASRVMATNFFGAHNVIRAVLPALRRQRSGHIVNVSSVGGFTGSAGFGLYNASKFALEGLSEALALELKPLGVGVTIVEPGYFRTEFLSPESALKAAAVIDDYAQTAGLTRSNVAVRDGYQPGDPAKAVRVIIEAVEAPNPPLHLPLGSDSLARIEAKIAGVQADIAAWGARAAATAFDS